MKICYVLAYREPSYIRTRSLLKALAQLPGLEVITAINRVRGLGRYADTLGQVKRIHQEQAPDCYILGFRGNELYWLLRRIIGKTPLILDSMMSPSAALCEDCKHGKLGRSLGGVLFYFEKAMLHNADAVLTDTVLHADFLSRFFDLPESKIYALPVGADEEAHVSSVMSQSNKKLQVLFYGSFLPLHGMGIMLQAAAGLRGEPVNFTFIGGKGKFLRQFHELSQRLKLDNLIHIPWVDFDALLNQYIAQTDLGLGGPFGNTLQGRRVITGKTSQFLALGKPVVVGESEQSLGFRDKQNCLLVPQGQPESLVESIRWALENRTKLYEIGINGQKFYQEQLSIKQITWGLQRILTLCH